jgi:hypothetical protein
MRMLGIPRALAERVKRTPALRVENPHIAHEEDGVHGPRFVVASGLVHLYASARAGQRSQGAVSPIFL